ncbi:MAG: 16S rRNA (uracil(1498)-N(3))-methyltransferase [Kiritimatiellae bacterium]|nr:16S rRNA (uracil(1498)-N(3))-methyltransferase [Kiritimatiellia bacterium]
MNARPPSSSEAGGRARVCPTHRPPRCFAPLLPPEGGMVLLEPEEARHLVVVLRLGPGAAVEAFDGAGRRALGRIAEVQRTQVWIEVGPARAEVLPDWRATLIQGAPKGDKKEMIVRAAVELGVQRVVFFPAERSVARPAPREVERWRQRWRSAAVAAAKQSGCNWLPEIVWAGEIERALEAGGEAGASFVCEAGEGVHSWAEARAAAGCSSSWKHVCAAVGPEGGWTAEELARFRAAGFRPVRIGGFILRVETAAIAMMALMVAELEFRSSKG